MMETLLRAGSLMIALLLAVQASAASGQSDASLSDTSVRLNHLALFAIGGTGFAGRISEGELDYKGILSLPPEQALKVFERAYSAGSPAARAYALLGIHKLAPDRFKELYMSLDDSTETVMTMQGCILSRTKLSLIAKQIDAGAYDRDNATPLLQRR